MRGSIRAWAAWLGLASIVAVPAELSGQDWGVGLSVLETDINAFGLGAHWSPRLAAWGSGVLRLHALLDLEMPQQATDDRYEREPDPSGGAFYYRNKVTLEWVHPDSAKVDQDPRLYYAVYAAAELWRFRAGPGISRGPWASAGIRPSAMVAFLATARSRLTVEFPDRKGYRIRLEFQFR